jgi:hypothetical protein
MSRPAWRVRACEQEDEAGIRELFAHTFGKPLSKAHWQWKLHTLPSPVENEWVAEVDRRIVGHYAVTPLRFRVAGREMLVPHGCDAMTHAGYRRQGILTALGERASAVWREEGAPFQIGFHYGGWGSVREQLGWRMGVRLVWMKRVLRPMAVLARRSGWQAPRAMDALFGSMPVRKASGLAEIRVESVEQAGPEFDLLWEQAANGYQVLAVRDRAWVRWRCLSMPGVEQRVLLAKRNEMPQGYLAYRVEREGRRVRAAIVDLFVVAGAEELAHALLAQWLREPAAREAESISALAPHPSALYNVYRRAGFWPSRQGYDFSYIPYQQPAHTISADQIYATGAEGDIV